MKKQLNFGKPEEVVNPQFFYRGNDIVKLWEQYLKINLDNQGQAIKFFTEENTSDTIFNDLAQQTEIAVVLNHDDTLYRNKDGKSITLCGEINYENQDIQQKIQAALNQLKTYNSTHIENQITDHIVVFPYHVSPLHWNLGIISLVIEAEAISNLTISIYEPFGGTSAAENKIFTQINDITIQDKNISKINNLTQQHDATSCGVIAAENGKEFLKHTDNQDNLLKKSYAPGAIELRQSHVKEINLDTFTKAQLLNEVYEARGDAEIENQEAIIDFFKTLIKNADYEWVRDILINLLTEKSDYILRANFNLFKQFIVQLSVTDVNNLDKYNSILKSTLEFQEGAINLINILATQVQEPIKIKQNLKKATPIQKQSLVHKKTQLYIKTDNDDTFEYDNEIIKNEIAGSSITPTTFKSRTLNSDLIWYIDEYIHKNNSVIRFGINYKDIKINTEDSSILNEKVELYNPQKGKSKDSQSTTGIERIAKSISHHYLEKQLLEKSVNYLLESNDTQTVLVDIFVRDNGGIKRDQENPDCPEIHTVVLYKNPIREGQNKHEVLVIDPSNFSFSSHLSNLNGTIQHKKLGEIITLHKVLQIYKANDPRNTGSEPEQYRDCTDIAVKIAFGLNQNKNLIINVDNIKEIDGIKFISNNDAINDSIPVDIQTKHFVNFPLRIQQKSNTKIPEDMYKFSKTIKDNLLKIENREPLQEKYLNTLLDADDHYHNQVHTLISLRSICENSFSIIREECETIYKKVLGDTIDINLYNGD